MFSCFRKKKKKLKGQPPLDRRFVVPAAREQTNHFNQVILLARPLSLLYHLYKMYHIVCLLLLFCGKRKKGVDDDIQAVTCHLEICHLLA